MSRLITQQECKCLEQRIPCWHPFVAPVSVYDSVAKPKRQVLIEAGIDPKYLRTDRQIREAWADYLVSLREGQLG